MRNTKIEKCISLCKYLRCRGSVLKSEKLVLFIGNVFFFLLLIFILAVHTARYYKLWKEENKARGLYQKFAKISIHLCASSINLFLCRLLCPYQMSPQRELVFTEILKTLKLERHI